MDYYWLIVPVSVAISPTLSHPYLSSLAELCDHHSQLGLSHWPRGKTRWVSTFFLLTLDHFMLLPVQCHFSCHAMADSDLMLSVSLVPCPFTQYGMVAVVTSIRGNLSTHGLWGRNDVHPWQSTSCGHQLSCWGPVQYFLGWIPMDWGIQDSPVWTLTWCKGMIHSSWANEEWPPLPPPVDWRRLRYKAICGSVSGCRT